ncbi:MAG: hypothetical protein E6Q97_08390 [Desulfurellales bacterium]|nr:MAG: hypothetical protein E6Q97_08390 [Desulfurellales bacterium]
MPDERTADNLEQASDAEINELIGAPSEPAPKPAAQTTTPSGTPPQPASGKAPAAQPAEPNTPETPQPSALGRLGRKAERDYSGFTEEEIAYFKKMGNDTFDWIAPIYRKYKSGQPAEDVTKKLAEYETKLKEAEGRQWFDHPESYRLSDEYTAAQTSLAEAQSVAKHWEKQLVAVDGGAKEFTGLQYDRDGNIVGVKLPVTPSTRADLIRRMQVANGDVENFTRSLDGVKESHGKRYGGYKSTLNEIYDKHFKPHEALLKKHFEANLRKFPDWFQARPEARLLAASLASNEVIMEHYEGQANANASTKLFQDASAAAGPSKAVLESGLPARPADGKKPFKVPTPEEEKAFAAAYL